MKRRCQSVQTVLYLLLDDLKAATAGRDVTLLQLIAVHLTDAMCCTYCTFALCTTDGGSPCQAISVLIVG